MDTISKTGNYMAVIEVPVSPQEASKLVSQVGQWWTKSFKGTAAKEGDTFSVSWGKTFVDFILTDMVPGAITRWLVTDCNLDFQEDKKEWKGTTVEWLFEQHPAGTRIQMTHIGLTPDVQCYEGCRKGWDQYVKTSLTQYIRTGKGQPD